MSDTIIQWVFIQAQDVWMFRDSKPFTAQQNFVAHSQFPPNPQTIQGMVRTHYLEAQGVNWRAYKERNERPEIYAAVGAPAYQDFPPHLGALRITGPLIARRNANNIEFLVHAPMDILRDKETGEQVILRVQKETSFRTAPPFDGWQSLVTPTINNYDPDWEAGKGWLTPEQFQAYLHGKVPESEFREHVIQIEDRMGLGMDHKRRANEPSLLYRASFARPGDDIGLVVGINMNVFDGEGYVRLGGESRQGKFEVLPSGAFTQPPITGSGRVKIVLLTPAYFSSGWQPADWSKWVGPQATLVSAVIGKPLAISGWDVANQRPKPLRNFVPSGSVYYFENAEVQAVPFTETPQSNQYPEADFAAMGFGGYAVGTWDYA